VSTRGSWPLQQEHCWLSKTDRSTRSLPAGNNPLFPNGFFSQVSGNFVKMYHVCALVFPLTNMWNDLSLVVIFPVSPVLKLLLCSTVCSSLVKKNFFPSFHYIFHAHFSFGVSSGIHYPVFQCSVNKIFYIFFFAEKPSLTLRRTLKPEPVFF